jgi:hypothetical protein
VRRSHVDTLRLRVGDTGTGCRWWNCKWTPVLLLAARRGLGDIVAGAVLCAVLRSLRRWTSWCKLPRLM